MIKIDHCQRKIKRNIQSTVWGPLNRIGYVIKTESELTQIVGTHTQNTKQA